MLYGSELMGQPIHDRNGTEMARIQDVVFRLAAAGTQEWPRLHGLVARTTRRGPGFFVSASRIAALRPGPVQLAAPGIALEAFQRRPGEVLARDLWDRRVIHCATQRVRRVNEVVLGLPDAPLPGPVPAAGYAPEAVVLLGVDVGLEGILLRLGLGRLLGRRGATAHPQILPWSEIDLLTRDAAGRAATTHSGLADLHPVEIARLTDNVSTLEAAEIIAALDDGVAADVLEELTEAQQAHILEYLPDFRARAILEEMDPDDASDLLADLPGNRATVLLDQMAPAASASVRTLLQYPENTAGGMMTTEYVRVPAHYTVRETIEALRTQAATPPVIYYVYAMDGAARDKLVGVVSLRQLLLAGPDDHVEALMEREFLSAAPLEADREVARKMAEYNLLALPVVDRAGQLLGVVTVDDALDVLLPSGWQRRLPRLFH